MRIATTHPIAAYGGIQLDEESISELAEAIASGDMPMHFSHDISRPIHAENVVAGVERLPDGHLAAWAEADVDTDAWDKFEAELDAAGAPGGMSISFEGPTAGRSLVHSPLIVVLADASHFDDQMILDAAAKFEMLGTTDGRRFFQLSHVPPIKVVLDFTLTIVGGVSLNMLASVLYDSTKAFLKRDRPTIFNIIARKSSSGRHTLKMHLATDSPEALKVAMEQAARALQAAAEGTFVFDPGEREFEKLEPPPGPPKK